MHKIHVLALNTSPKNKGNTFALLQEAMQGCESVGATTESISVKGKKLTPCQGCSVCQSGKSCPLQDDVPEILLKMQAADVILLASPTFFYNVTAQCKIIMDRSYAVQPLNDNKVGGIFITAGSMGTSAAVNSCNMFFTVHGVASAGYVSSLGATQDNPKAMQSAYDLGIKTVMMAKVLKDAPQVFGMHSHYAYGTHTKWGSEILLFPTEEGLHMEEKIYKAWKKLYTDYSVILGEAEGIELTRTCLDASRKLQQKDDAS